MSLSDEIDELELISDSNRIEKESTCRGKSHVKGWEKGVALDAGSGYVYSGQTDTEPTDADWLSILDELGLDSATYEIDPDGSVDARVWDSNVGGGVIKRLHYYRAKVRLKGRHVWMPESEFAAGLEKYKAPKKQPELNDPNGFVVCLSDWQVGKLTRDSENGGSVEIRDRIMVSAEAALVRLAQLRKLGVEIETVYIIGMGDMVEACTGQYPSQAFSTDLNERQQFRLASRLFRNIVIMFSKKASRVVVTSVGGNHGENRLNGKMFTDPGDNKDTMLIEMCADALESNPEAFGHVKFVPLENKLWATLDIYGTVCGFTHGHLPRAGATPEAKQRKWLSDQALGKNDIGDVDVFVTGHYHSFQLADWGPRMWLQCPTQDGGSEWFQNARGVRSVTGTLTFVAGPASTTPADYIKIV